MSVRFRGGGTVVAVWPTGRNRDPFFYLQHGRASINNVRQARDTFPDVGVVPVLSPLEDQEELLTAKYVRENLDGRLASRHFRNQLVLLQDEDDANDLDAFLEFATPWIPEVKIGVLDRHRGDKNLVLDLYYVEPGRRTKRRSSGLATESRFGCSYCCMSFAFVITMLWCLTSRTYSSIRTFNDDW